MNNLILTISDNYNFFHLSRFFFSLFKTSFKGKAVLFAGPNTKKDSLQALEELGVEVISYRNEFPFISSPHESNFSILPTPIHIYNFRHFLYYDYILKHESEFDNVLLSDVRDVVFQKDPFDFPIQKTLYVAMENRNRLTRDCKYNTAWILNGYDSSILAEMAPHVISCAGTTLGHIKRIKQYLFLLLTEINSIKDAYGCADQAIHNRLLQTGKLDPVIRLYNDNEYTPVITVGAEPDFVLERGFLQDSKGNIPGIVHQYDRHKALLDAVDTWVFDNLFHKYYLKLKYKFFG